MTSLQPSIPFVLALAVAIWWTLHVQNSAYRLGLKHGRQLAALDHRHEAEREEMAAAKAAWERARGDR